MKGLSDGQCKICLEKKLEVYLHTAKCRSCGVLLCYPYPEVLSPDYNEEESRAWYRVAGPRNIRNFESFLRFAIAPNVSKFTALDFGGGGGQFAVVCKARYPESTIYIVDRCDDALLSEWKGVNHQIRFDDFATDPTSFDYVFLNDVFEHLESPVEVLRLVASRLKADGRVFIDTPRQFWLYPFLKKTNKGLYKKLLIGSVSNAHLQIWTKKSIKRAITDAGLFVDKYAEVSEFTMPPNYYLQNMGITNWVMRVAGSVFYRLARYVARNKIQCLVRK